MKDDLTGLTPIEITEKMINAGVDAALEHRLGAPLKDLVYDVYFAMQTVVNMKAEDQSHDQLHD